MSLALRTRSFIIHVYIACNLSSDISGQTFNNSTLMHISGCSPLIQRGAWSQLEDFQQWLGEEIQQVAQRGKHEVTNMSLHFSGVGSHARLFEAPAVMLSRNALNPAGVSILYISTMRRRRLRRARLLHIIYMYHSYWVGFAHDSVCIDPLPNLYFCDYTALGRFCP